MIDDKLAAWLQDNHLGPQDGCGDYTHEISTHKHQGRVHKRVNAGKVGPDCIVPVKGYSGERLSSINERDRRVKRLREQSLIMKQAQASIDQYERDLRRFTPGPPAERSDLEELASMFNKR